MFNVQFGSKHINLLPFTEDCQKFLDNIPKKSYIGIETGGHPIQFLAWYISCKLKKLIPVLIHDINTVDTSISECLDSIVKLKDGNYEFCKLANKLSLISNSKNEISVVIATSGSTGKPRYTAWHGEGISYQNYATNLMLAYKPSDVVLNMCPLWSSYGLSLVHLWLEGYIKLAILPKNEYRNFLNFVEKYKITHIEAVPRIYLFILSILEKDSTQIRKQRYVKHFGCGGDVLLPSFSQKWTDCTGSVLYNGYGLTECGPNVALSCKNAYKPGSVGKILKRTTIEISSESEVVINSPSIMFSNWDFLEQNPKILPKLFSGDIGCVDDDGYLFINGRKKNVIIINGIKFYPEEIETTISEYKYIKNIFLTDVNIDNKTKLVACYTCNKQFSKEDLHSFCKNNLPSLQIPNFYLQLPALPLNKNGKIDRLNLRRIANNFISKGEWV